MRKNPRLIKNYSQHGSLNPQFDKSPPLIPQQPQSETRIVDRVGFPHRIHLVTQLKLYYNPLVKLTPEEELTVNAYNDKAAIWSEAYSNSSYWQNELRFFTSLLPSGKVLEIGCGGGRDARLLLPQYDYVGTDLSEGFLQVASQNLGQANLIRSNLYELPFPENMFDGFWASAVLLHLPKSRIDHVLWEVKRICRPEGIGFISIKQGLGEKVIEDENEAGTKLNRFWAFYSPEEFQQTLEKKQFCRNRLPD